MTSVTNNRSGNLIFRSGFRPELIIVASGSYQSNFNFGAGATVIQSLNFFTTPHGISGEFGGGKWITSIMCEYKRQDNFVVFSLNLTIEPDNPGGQGGNIEVIPSVQGEVRFRVLNPLYRAEGNSPLFYAPNSYSRGLPTPSSNYMSPTVDFAALYLTTDTGQYSQVALQAGLAPTVGVTNNGGRMNARILADSTIALFYNYMELVDTDGLKIQGPLELPVQQFTIPQDQVWRKYFYFEICDKRKLYLCIIKILLTG
jgi:hypothetical protein